MEGDENEITKVLGHSSSPSMPPPPPPPLEERIVDRKRFQAGLPNSFSSNLTHKNQSPPLPPVPFPSPLRRKAAAVAAAAAAGAAAAAAAGGRNVEPAPAASSPCGNGAAGGSNSPSTGVRAIVDWLEKTNGDNKSGGGSSGTNGQKKDAAASVRSHKTSCGQKSDSTNSITTARRGKGPSSPASTTAALAQKATPSPAIPLLPTEDYSLTLLKHKQYFNNRPLGRCLDDAQPAGTSTAGVDAAAAGFSCRAVERTTFPRSPEDKTIVRVYPPVRSGPEVDRVARGDDYSVELPTGNRTAGAGFMQKVTGDRSEAGPAGIFEDNEASTAVKKRGHDIQRRDPEEVNVFWTGVRAALYISDAEIESTYSWRSSFASRFSSASSTSSSPPVHIGGDRAVAEQDDIISPFPEVTAAPRSSAQLAGQDHRTSDRKTRRSRSASEKSSQAEGRTQSAAHPEDINSRYSAEEIIRRQRHRQASTTAASSSMSSRRSGEGGGEGIATSGRTSRRRLTTEEKMSEIDEFLTLDG